MLKKEKKYNLIRTIRFLWSYIRKYKGLFFIVIGLCLTTSLVNVATPFVFGQIIDNFLGKQIIFSLTLSQLLLAWVVLIIVRIISRRVVVIVNIKLEVFCQRDLVCDLVKKIMNLPIKYHYDQKPGEIYKKVDRASNAISNIIDNVFFNFVENVFGIILALIVMMTISWQLTVVNLLFITAFFIFAGKYKMKEILHYRKKMNSKYNTIFGNIGDIIANIFAVKVNTSQKYEQKRLKKDFNQAAQLVNKEVNLWTQVTVGQGIISNGGTISMVVIASFMMMNQTISPGQFTTFIIYLNMIYGPIWSLSHTYRMLKRWMVDLADAHNIFKQKQEKIFSTEIKDVNLKGEIEFKNVYFKYPQRKQGVLDNISFKVKQGHTLAIFGETGSGKTTIYNLLLRLFEQDQGKILVDKINTKKINRQIMRSQIAVVPQDAALFNESISYNIKYSKPEATMAEVITAAKIANAHKFISDLPKGYETKVGERGVKLSGGQVQRIAIARAALRKPKILILDEATAQLDQKTKFEVLDALNNLIAERTTIIITHDFSAITQNADHIIVLDNGKIVEQGKHSDLIQQPGPYYDLWQTQQKHLES